MDNYKVTPIVRETPSSIELTRNAKGDMQWAIKVYSAVGDEEAAATDAVSIDDMLRKQYGVPPRTEQGQ